MTRAHRPPITTITKIRVWMRPNRVGSIAQILFPDAHLSHWVVERTGPIRLPKPWRARSSAISCAAIWRPRNVSTPGK